MRNITKKIIFLVVFGLLIIEPVFSMITNSHIVNAKETYIKTIFGDYTEKEIQNKILLNQTYKFKGTSYRLIALARGTAEFEVEERYSKALRKGLEITTDDYRLRNVIIASVKTVKTINRNGASYSTIQLVVVADYDSGWQKYSEISQISAIPVKYEGANIRFTINVKPVLLRKSQKASSYDIYNIDLNESSKNNTSNSLLDKIEKLNKKSNNESSKENTSDSIGDIIKNSIDNSKGTNSGTNSQDRYDNLTVDRTDMTDDARRLYIRNLYKRVLGREPTKNEIDVQFKKDTPKIARDIILSAASDKKNFINSLSNDSFINACYSFILGRKADTSGLLTYKKRLNEGHTKQSIINILSTSSEFYTYNNRKTQRITLSKELCNACYNSLLSNGINVLKISDTQLLMFAEDLGNVDYLDLSGKELNSLSGIANFKNIKKINISNNKITTLKDIEALNNLEELIANDNSFQDISSISKLTKLRNLELSNCNIGNKLEQMGQLPNLKQLKFNNNKLNSTIISNLEKYTKLESLSLNNNSIDNLTTIKKLANLKELYLDNNVVKEFADIGSMNLSKVSIKNNCSSILSDNNEIELKDFLKNVKDKNNKLYTSNAFVFENCRIDGNKIVMDAEAENASIVIKGGALDGYKLKLKNQARIIVFYDKVLADKIEQEFKNVKRIDENGKYILQLTLQEIQAKKSLDLSRKVNESDYIRDIRGLEKISRLESLNLRNNQIQNLEVLSEILTLKTLDIRNNGLTNLNSIANLKNLVQLDASSNLITDITGLAQLKNLKDLFLSRNKLGNDISIIGGLTQLEYLGLQGNGIKDISQLSSLKLKGLYLSGNNIISLSSLNKESLDYIEANNNILNYYTRNGKLALPEIVQIDINNNNGTSNLEFTGCSIIDNEIVLERGVRIAEIKIKTGIWADTVIEIEDMRAYNPPVLNVNYELNNSETTMTVTISADKEIQGVLSWDSIDNGCGLRKQYKYNVSNQYIVVRDLYGNETRQLIQFTGVKHPRIPDLTVSYDKDMITNQDVTVTMSSSENLVQYGISWKLSEDKKHLSKVISSNTSSTYTTAIVFTESMFNSQMQPVNVDIEVSSIDKEKPVCSVEYDTINLTKGSVKATIWANEEIHPVGIKDFTCTRRVENNSEKYGIILYFNENTTKNIVVKDLAGNESPVTLNVENIDNSIAGVNYTISSSNSTNGNITLNITADEKIELVGEKIKEASNMLLFKVANTSNNDAMLYRLAEVTSGSGSNTITIDITEGETRVISLVDSVGNEDQVVINSNVIDKEAPVITEERTENSDGSVTIELKCNEPISINENANGWSLGENGMSVLKTFYSDVVENIEIFDMAGNTSYYTISVGNVKEFAYEVYYKKIEDTDLMVVVIEADRKIKPIDGWILSEDEMSIGKVFNINDSAKVVIYDKDDNKEEVSIEPKFDNIINEVIEEYILNILEDNDTTQAKEELPNSGVFILSTILLSIALTIVSAFTLIQTEKNEYI